MNKAQLLTALIQSGRVSIIPVGFTGEEGEGDLLHFDYLMVLSSNIKRQI